MTFSGNPGETYSVPKLLAVAFGILRAVGVMSKKKPLNFNDSLKQLEESAEEMIDAETQGSNRHQDENPDVEDSEVIEYTKIIEQINAVERNWLDGETL